MSIGKDFQPRSSEQSFPEVRKFDGHDWHSTKTYRRNLPHWELKGSTYFITIRVDQQAAKPFRDVNLASFMASCLCESDKNKYLLQAYVIMPDHLHFIIKPIFDNTLSQIMQKMKGSTAHSINKLLNRSGKFWQTENFDHLIRNGLDLRDNWEYI